MPRNLQLAHRLLIIWWLSKIRGDQGGIRRRPSCCDEVVDVTTFHTNPDEQIETVLAVRAEEIGAPPYPNWTAVGVNWLAGFDFEIKVIARIPLTTSGQPADKR
jgi:hypothetical protein